MSLKEKILSTVGDVFAPIVESLVTQVVSAGLVRLKEVDKSAYRVSLTSLYGPLDVYLEAMVEKTETALDDAIVNGLMTAIEASAGQDGIELPNLDDD